MPKLTRYRMLGCCAVMFITGTFSARLEAQSTELRLGDVARVSAPTLALDRFVGRIVSLTADTVALETDEPAARIAIPRSALTSAERRMPNASRAEHALSGAGLGLLGGAAAGGLVGAASGKSCNLYSDGLCGRGAEALAGAVAGGVLGLIVGTTIGLALPVERWSPMKDVQLGVAPMPAVAGGRVLVALRF